MTRRKGWSHGIAVDKRKGDAHGFSPTWPPATRALLVREHFVGPIWEPMCGDGAISNVLLDAGYDVISSDLIDRDYGEVMDFLDTHDLRVPTIITNPDFRIAERSIKHALRCTTHKVAMFLRLAFLEGERRGRWYPTTPLARIYVFSRRVPMQRGRIALPTDVGGMIAYAWFVWDHSYVGDPTIHFLDWMNPEA